MIGYPMLSPISYFAHLYYLFHCYKGAPMKNVNMKLTGTILTITVDISKEFGLSSSGKSLIIASTEGNVSVEGKEEVKVGLNIYKKP